MYDCLFTKKSEGFLIIEDYNNLSPYSVISVSVEIHIKFCWQ